MKKITVLFTVLLMLAASSVYAAVDTVFPAYFNQTFPSGTFAKGNGTVLYYTGFGVNATAGSIGSGTVQEMIPFAVNMTAAGKSEAFYINASKSVRFSNASIVGYNGTVKNVYALNSTKMDLIYGQQFGNVVGLMGLDASIVTDGLAPFNGTTTTGHPLFVTAGNYQLLVGLANGTLGSKGVGGKHLGNMSPASVTPRLGLSMPIIYANGTFKDVASTSTTWDYYGFGQSNNLPVMIFAQVKINSMSGSANAQVKYYMNNGTNKVDKTGTWMNFNASGLTKIPAVGGIMSLTRDGGITLFENATINHDKNMVTGFVSAATQKLFGVMIKSGTTLGTNDIKTRGFNLIYLGSGYEGQGAGNATAGILQFNADENLNLTGNARVLEEGATASQTAASVALGGMSLRVATTSQFKLSQSNMTVYDADGKSVIGSFYGKQSADKVASVGFFEDTDGYRALAFLMPTGASTAATLTGEAGYQSNSTFGFAPTYFNRNATGYTQADLRARWAGIPSNFTPLTDVKGYRMYASNQKGNFYFSAQYKMNSVGGKVSDLRLYKVMADSKTVRAFNYAAKATPSTEGSWWISTNSADGYLNQNSVLDPATDYYVTWVVKDNGSYDSNGTSYGIVDPVILGTVPPSDSSSSSGCVFNPAASFGLEWLLLMLAPMVAIVRSRFKK